MSNINPETGEVIENKAGEIVIIPPRSAIVKPAVTPQEAVDAWKEYEALKKQIISKDDIQQIQGRDFLKKSYWKKCATFFNLSIDKIEENRIAEGDGSITFETTYRATAPNGRSAVGDGACNTLERGGRANSIHNTRSTAHTRAANRAISNLVGGGEISAEEADQETVGSTFKPNPPGSTSSYKYSTISKPQAGRFVRLAREAGLSQPMWEGLLKKFNYKTPEEIHPKDYEMLCGLAERKDVPRHKDDEAAPHLTDDDIRY